MLLTVELILIAIRSFLAIKYIPNKIQIQKLNTYQIQIKYKSNTNQIQTKYKSNTYQIQKQIQLQILSALKVIGC